MPILGDIVLSAVSNDFACVSCSNNYGMLVSKREFNSLKIIANTEWSKLNSVKLSEEILMCCINILKYDLQNITNYRFKTI